MRPRKWDINPFEPGTYVTINDRYGSPSYRGALGVILSMRHGVESNKELCEVELISPQCRIPIKYVHFQCLSLYKPPTQKILLI